MIRIKEWSSYQSYKDRKPPWIRLHKKLLENYKFHMMSDNARALLPMFWLLASEDDDPTSGLIRIDYDEISFKLRTAKEKIEAAAKECEAAGFIECDSQCYGTVTDSLHNGHASVTPENREQKEYNKPSKQVDGYSDEFEKFWNSYPRYRRREKKKAFQAWQAAIKHTPAEKILFALERYKKLPESREFAPYPAKWLKGEYWEATEGECVPLTQAERDKQRSEKWLA